MKEGDRGNIKRININRINRSEEEIGNILFKKKSDGSEQVL